MARTSEGALLTERHRVAQVGLRAAALRDLTVLWRSVRVDDLRGTIGPFAVAGAQMVRARHRESAGQARDYFQVFRRVERVSGAVAVIAADPPAELAAASSLRGSALAGVIDARRRGRPMEAAARAGLTRCSGSMSDLVLDGARDMLTRAAESDPQSTGRWQRVTSGDPCAFCAMLAARGPVFSRDTGGFDAHSHCACQAEVVFEGSQMSDRSQRLANLWESTTEGLDGAGALNAFRQSIEGR